MKHLKKACALTLTLALLAGLLCTQALAAPGGAPAAVPPATADGLGDYAAITQKDAVATLMKLGLVSGVQQADGTFDYLPAERIDRASMAKLVALAATLVSGEAVTGATGFSDIAGSWARDYIQYCADKGILSGTGAGAFEPAAAVTGTQTAKMLLSALGVDGLTGDGWADATDAAARERGLYEGITADMSAPLTRDDAARMICNALTASDGAAVLPKLTLVSESTQPGALTVGANELVTAPEGRLVTLLVDGAAAELKAGTYQNASLAVTADIGNLSSFTAGGQSAADNDYAFRPGVYIENNRIVAAKSVLNASLADGVLSALSVKAADPGFNPIVINDSQLTLEGLKLDNTTDADGSETCDFSGLGAALAVYGDESVVTVKNSDIRVSGVANLALFADDGADVVIQGSTLVSEGGTLYSDYLNSPAQDTMVAPPWILGIMGTSRTTNLMGENSSTTVLDSVATAAQWAVLSTDSGSNMKLNVANTDMDLTGADYPLQQTNSDGQTYYRTKNPFTDRSGYGTYAIGNADETFWGVSMNVGTYATIFTGGSGRYTNLEKGKTYEMKSALDKDVVTTYTSQVDRNTVLNSDTFGFMAHQGTNNITVENGTQVNSGYATFLLKDKDADSVTTINVTSGAQLNPKNGVLVQVLDNDDTLTGLDMATFSFLTDYNEKAGWPSENGSVTSALVKAADPAATQLASTARNVFNAADVTLTGDLYNGSGYWASSVGGQNGVGAVALDVNLGAGATLTGKISATETIHVNENYKPGMTDDQALACQNTHFTISEYFYIGHVANRNHYNGHNDVNVTLSGGAVWNVTGESLLSSLRVGEGCTLNGSVTVDGVPTAVAPGVTYTGAIVVSAG